jgi:undecaprenyl-diphosphatase
MGTLLAVFVVMRKEIAAILKDLFGRLTWLILLATVPAILFAVLLGDLVDRLFQSGATLGFEFLFTGAVLIAAVFAKPGVRPLAKLRVVDAVAGGVGQAVAILPAVSRSACTLVPLLFLGVERKAAIRFTFLLSIPAILGGFVLGLKGVLTGDTGALLQIGAGNLVVGVLAAAVAGFVAMRLMLNLLTRRGFLYFGIYVVLLGAFVLLDQNVLHWIF